MSDLSWMKSDFALLLGHSGTIPTCCMLRGKMHHSICIQRQGQGFVMSHTFTSTACCSLWPSFHWKNYFEDYWDSVTRTTMTLTCNLTQHVPVVLCTITLTSQLFLLKLVWLYWPLCSSHVCEEYGTNCAPYWPYFKGWIVTLAVMSVTCSWHVSRGP